MNMIPVLANAFGVDPTRFEAQVAAYEAGECRLCENTGKVGATPCPLCDRLALVERRHIEAGGGDADKGWLIEEVKKLREVVSERGPWGPVVPSEKPHGERLHESVARAVANINAVVRP